MGIPKGSKRPWSAGRKRLTKEPEDIDYLYVKVPHSLLEEAKACAGGNLSQFVREAVQEKIDGQSKREKSHEKKRAEGL